MGVSFKAKVKTPSVLKDPKKFKQQITKAAERTRNQIKRDFEKTTKNWKTEVDFEVKRKRTGDTYTFTASTDNEIYGYVNNGTRPHLIEAKNAPFLVFAYGGTPKTQPNVLKSGKGSRGTKWASKKSVKHPGTEARNFDTIIKDRFKVKWTDEANAVLRQYLQTTTRPAGRFR